MPSCCVSFSVTARDQKPHPRKSYCSLDMQFFHPENSKIIAHIKMWTPLWDGLNWGGTLQVTFKWIFQVKGRRKLPHSIPMGLYHITWKEPPAARKVWYLPFSTLFWVVGFFCCFFFFFLSFLMRQQLLGQQQKQWGNSREGTKELSFNWVTRPATQLNQCMQVGKQTGGGSYCAAWKQLSSCCRIIPMNGVWISMATSCTERTGKEGEVRVLLSTPGKEQNVKSCP